MRKLDKRQFCSKNINLPMRHSNIFDPETKNFIPTWVDDAIGLGKVYLKKQSQDTIFEQMILLEMILAELRENMQKEDDKLKQESIESKIASTERSRYIRENYLRNITGNNYETLYNRTKKSIDKRFLEFQKDELKKKISELAGVISQLEYKSNKLACDSNYYSSTAIGPHISDQEKEVAADLEEAQKEFGRIKNLDNEIGE